MLHFSISVILYQLKLFSFENIQLTPYSIIYGQIEDIFLQKFRFRNRLFVYRRLLMVGTKSRGYSNSGWLSEGEYSMPFFSTSHSPSLQTSLPSPQLLRSADAKIDAEMVRKVQPVGSLTVARSLEKPQ